MPYLVFWKNSLGGGERLQLVCEACIPQLPLVFTNSFLQKIYNHVGKKASGLTDYWEFRRLLIETGIVGRVVNVTDRYNIGRFEYTEPHKLVVSTEEQLCLHPVFATVFHYKKVGGQKVIYPYGYDIEGADYREWEHLD